MKNKDCHYYYNYSSPAYIVEGSAGTEHWFPDGFIDPSNIKPYSVFAYKYQSIGKIRT